MKPDLFLIDFTEWILNSAPRTDLVEVTWRSIYSQITWHTFKINQYIDAFLHKCVFICWMNIMHEYEVHIKCPIECTLLVGKRKTLGSWIILFWIIVAGGRVYYCSEPAQWICHRAVSILNSEAKYCGVEYPIWMKWDARLNVRLDNACHHPHMYRPQAVSRDVFNLKD